MNNLLRPTLSVRHADLIRVYETSAYKSLCPTCKTGILPMRRHHKSYRLLRRDTCLSCHQRVLYTDLFVGNELFYDPDVN